MAPQEIALRDPGAVERQTGGEDIVTYARWVVESGLFGQGVTQAQAGLKMLVGRELGIQPLAAVRNIYIFQAQGRPVVILDATLMGAMVRTSGRYDFEVERHDETGTVLAMYRLDGSKRTLLGRESFTVADAAARGLKSKEGPWKQGYVKEMCYARAMSRLVDHYAPELLLGLSVPVVTQEQADDMPMEPDQRKAIFAGLRQIGKGDISDAERHSWASSVVGRPVASFAELAEQPITRMEAGLLIDDLKRTAESMIGLREPVQATVVQEVAGSEPQGSGWSPEPEPAQLPGSEPASTSAGTGVSLGEVAPDPAASLQGGEGLPWRDVEPGAGDEGKARASATDRPADAGLPTSEERRPAPAPAPSVSPEELAALRQLAQRTYQASCSADPKRWRPWWRNACLAIRPDGYEAFPAHWDASQLRLILDRFAKEESLTQA